MWAIRDASNQVGCESRQDTLFVTRRGGSTRLLALVGMGKPPAKGHSPAAMQALGRQAAAAARSHRAASMAIAVLPAKAATAQVRLRISLKAYASVGRFLGTQRQLCPTVTISTVVAATCLLLPCTVK